MAVKQNTLLPVLGVLGIVIIGTILFMQFTSDGSVKSGDPISKVPKPTPLPTEKGADGDNASETLKSVVASNEALRVQVQGILERNAALEKEKANAGDRFGRNDAEADGAGGAMDAAGRAADNLLNGLPSLTGPASKNLPGSQVGRVVNAAPIVGDMVVDTGEGFPGAVAYEKKIPLGFAAFEDTRNRNQGPAQTRYVRTIASASGSDGSAMSGGDKSAALKDKGPVDEAYFTIPENATLVGVKAMTSIIGRVPIDGRVTDPMQFKAVVGRENLAANGWELPDDLAGMIVTGVAIGDMALSCSEGKIRSATFVFNDGTIRTVSSRSRAGRGGGSAAISGDLGFISDPHGNPCIPGTFVTNAPAYLTDIVGAKTLGVAASAFADAAKLVTQNSSFGSTTTQITDTNKYVMGQAVSGASDEFTDWLLSRLKNSFDAVVTPSGHELVVHLDQELRIDKLADARKLVHRNQASQNSTRGALYGLE